MKIVNEVITSRANPTVKWVASLAEKKGRAQARAFIAEGVKLTLEALNAELPITHLLVCESKRDAVFAALEAQISSPAHNDCVLMILADSVFEKISTEKAPQGVISVIKYLDFFKYVDIIYKEDFFLKEYERAIILHSVRDPLNLGSVIRSAVAFGTEHIILTADCADVYNPKTVRSAMGSLFRVSITVVADVSSLIEALRREGRRVYSAELNENALSLDEISLSPTDVVMIGNEGHGVPAEISRLCDSAIYIPISSRTESLNASVAAAIFMWEQRK